MIDEYKKEAVKLVKEIGTKKASLELKIPYGIDGRLMWNNRRICSANDGLPPAVVISLTVFLL